MQNDDRSAIEGLFGRLADAEKRAPARDAQAEAYIHARVDAQPAAPYYMAQTIIVQEQALAQAQARIESMQAELAAQGASSLGLDADRGAASRPADPPVRSAAPWGGRAREGAASQGGGFLAGAAQTAIGVAGGVLIANALGGVFASSAEAATDAPADAPDAPGGPMGGEQEHAAVDSLDGDGEESGGFLDMLGLDDFEF